MKKKNIDKDIEKTINKVDKIEKEFQEAECKIFDKDYVMADYTFLKSIIPEYLKKRCSFCGDKITKKNFGFVSKDETSCNNLLCLTMAINKFEKEK